MGDRARPASGALKPAVRPVRADDLDQVVAIERQSFSDPWSAQAFMPFIGASNCEFRVAEEGRRVVGYMVALVIGEEAEILNIAVAPPERGRGIAATLMDDALARLRERQVRAVYLEVRDGNARARVLYESRGFSEAGRRRRYYREPVEDALILTKQLEGDSR